MRVLKPSFIWHIVGIFISSMQKRTAAMFGSPLYPKKLSALLTAATESSTIVSTFADIGASVLIGTHDGML